MKKLCFIGILLALTPSLSFGDDFRINKLIQEKQRKMAELEKCMGSTKGLKIAGISTLGLTAVGVAGNVIEAKKIKEYDDKIESTEKSIAKTQKQIEKARADLAKQQAEAGQDSSQIVMSETDKVMQEKLKTQTFTTGVAKNKYGECKGFNVSISAEDCKDLLNETWFVEGEEMSSGGVSSCSVTKGVVGQAGALNDESDGAYCWCSMLGAQGTDSDTLYLSNSSWVYIGDLGSNCGAKCAYECATKVLNDKDIRKVIMNAVWFHKIDI